MLGWRTVLAPGMDGFHARTPQPCCCAPALTAITKAKVIFSSPHNALYVLPKHTHITINEQALSWHIISPSHEHHST